MGMYLSDKERFCDYSSIALSRLIGNKEIVEKVLNSEVDYTPVVEIETEKGKVTFKGDRAVINFTKHMTLLKKQKLIWKRCNDE